jgi:hypothetical protein
MYASRTGLDDSENEEWCGVVEREVKVTTKEWCGVVWCGVV